MGNASFGSDRQELEPGDYRAQVTDVKCEQVEDFKDKTKKKPAFVFGVDIQNAEGDWESRKLITSRVFTDMSPRRDGKPPPAKFVSTLNKLVRACGFPVPQSAEAVEAWDENSLVGQQFIWRVVDEVDEETGNVERVRKFIPLRPQAQAAEPATVTVQPHPSQAPPPPAAQADDDPFADGEARAA